MIYQEVKFINITKLLNQIKNVLYPGQRRNLKMKKKRKFIIVKGQNKILIIELNKKYRKS